MKMPPRFFPQLIAAAFIIFGSAANLLASSGGVPATVQEAADGDGTTQYTVNNTSTAFTPGGRFDISLFLSTTTGSTPTTTNSNWIAQSVNATSWTQTMGGISESDPRVSWQTYTGLTYTQAFPGNPVKLNGYFLNYTFNSGSDTVSFPTDPVFPGAGLGGFFFTGSPASTFFVAGPTDGTTSFTPGNVVTSSGTSTDVPEPASLSLLGVAALALPRWRSADWKR